MKILRRILVVSTVVAGFIVATQTSRAAINTWTGAGASNVWNLVDNWLGGVPQNGNDLVFTNTATLVNSNNFVGRSFNSINFATPSGAFVLQGNQATVTGSINDNQAVTAETVGLPLIFSSPVTVDVTANGVLNLTNVISGTGSIVKTSSGILNLRGNNTLAGSLTVNGGTVGVNLETNLPAAPTTYTAGDIVLNTGILSVGANLTLNTNRGVTVGSPGSPGGWGAVNINSGFTFTNGGVIADNTGGASGFAKKGPGTVVLFGANAYTGPTSNRVGTLSLDFSRPNAPANNIISASSAFNIGGENAGVAVTSGTINPIQLLVTNLAGAANSQTFNGTFVDQGGSVIRVSGPSSGSLALSLGALSHTPGGAVTLVTNGLSSINTTTPNLNGILGGWALVAGPGGTVVQGVVFATNWASVDVNGNIVPFAGPFYNAQNGVPIVSQLTTTTTNVLIGNNTNATIGLNNISFNTDNAGTTNDINSLMIARNIPFGFSIGTNNTLRLGQYGGILLLSGLGTYEFGDGVTNGSGAQDSGTLTAGGAPDTAGEIVFTIDSTSQTGGTSLNVETKVVNNGSGQVSVVKSGPGPMKLRGHNTFTGNMYIIQGRIQEAGGELGVGDLGGTSANTANPDGFGLGACYVLPGGEAFPSGAGGNTNAGLAFMTNNWFLAGNGVSDQVGVIRLPGSGIFSNAVMTLIGDARIGGGATNNVANIRIHDKITGPFNLEFGVTGNPGSAGTGVTLANTSNDWTGNLNIFGRNAVGGSTLVALGASEVIPDGFGKGNVTIGATTTTAGSKSVLDLNGFNETINGLSSAGSAAQNLNEDIIQNSALSTVATLTVGNNNATATFGGIMADNNTYSNSVPGGKLALTKIGAGVETLTNINTYSGNTTISNGVLQLAGPGLINNSTNINIGGGTFDVSLVSYTIPANQIINVIGGAFQVGTATGASSTVNFTNGTLRINTPSLITPNLTAGTVNVASGSVISVTLPKQAGFPVIFPVVKYTTLNGFNNFSAALPGGFTGFLSNDVVTTKTVYLVVTDGPFTPTITWTGNIDSTWDNANFVNDWTYRGNATNYIDGDIALFDNTSSHKTVNIGTPVFPGDTMVSNLATYTFNGSGGISGSGRLIKDLSGLLILDSTGSNDFSGGVIINAGGGTVQVGNGDAGGGIGTGPIANSGTLAFNRFNDATLVVPGAISGAGNVIVTNSGGPGSLLSIVTLSGNSTFTGSLTVYSNSTLKVGNNGALGSTNGSTVVSYGASLDINARNVGQEPVTVSGPGVLNPGDNSTNGAIYSSGTSVANGLARVVLAGDTVIGAPSASSGLNGGGNSASNRWSIASPGGVTGDPSTASLMMNGSAHNLVKANANTISIVSATVDPLLGNVDVQGGILSIEGNTTGLGNSSASLFVRGGATLQLYGAANPVNKQVQMDDATTIISDASPGVTTANNFIKGSMVLGGLTTVYATNSTLNLSNAISGTGSITKSGSGSLVLAGTDSHSGGIIINDGTLVLNTANNSTASTSEITLNPLTGSTVTLGGNGTFKGAADVEDTLWPGVAGKASTLNIGNNVDYSNPSNGDPGFGALAIGLGTASRAIFSLNTATTTGSGVNDLVSVTGGINVNNAKVYINPVTPLFTGSLYTLMTYNSGAENSPFGQVAIYPPALSTPNRYQLTLQDTGNGLVRLSVTSGAGALTWNNAATTGIWDVTNSVNWFNNGGATNDYFAEMDSVVLDDTIANSPANTAISLSPYLSGTTNVGLRPGLMTIISTNNNFSFSGTGKLSGPGNLVKKGPSKLTMGTTNDYTGTTVIAAGTIVVNATNALGAVGSPVIVSNGATLDVGGPVLAASVVALGAKPIIISGWGVSSNGAIVSGSAVQQLNALQNITLTGDTAFGGPGDARATGNPGRWDMRGGTPALSTGGNAYNLYKVGSNQVSLVGVTVDTNLGDIFIQGGEFGLETTTTLGNPTKTITVSSGASLEFFTLGNVLDKKIIANGGAGLTGATNVAAPNIWFNSGVGYPTNVLVGLITLTNGSVIVGGGGSGTLSNTVSGPGGLMIAGKVTLMSPDTYTGATVVSNNGTLFLSGAASILSTPGITVNGGTVDVSARTNSLLTIVSGQTLAGAGTIAGSLSNAAGSTLLLGTNGAVGQLVVTTNAWLKGSTFLHLNAGASTNDLLNVGGNLVIGGSLNVTNLGGSLAGGQSYKLFNAATYTTNYTGITPSTPGANMVWDASGLGVDGTLKIVSTGPGTFSNKPRILSFALSGLNVSISGTNGQAGDAYYLLTSTNVAQPLAQWTVIATNVVGSVGANGSFSFTGTNVVIPADQQQFYILSNTNSNHP